MFAICGNQNRKLMTISLTVKMILFVLSFFSFVIFLIWVTKMRKSKRKLEKDLRIKSAECEYVRVVGKEYDLKYEERSTNCKIIEDKNVNFDNG